MASKLSSSPTAWRLARDLGLRPVPDALTAVLAYCERRVRSFLKEFTETPTIEALLEFAANKVGTSFEVIRNDGDLDRVIQTYTGRGERGFAALCHELSDAVLGVTFKLTKAQDFELQYVSVIDCRGSKAPRMYFTMWHEIGHLLLLTDQTRLQFYRTHGHGDDSDPEERIVDIVAARFGFYAPLLQEHVAGEASFEEIDRVRRDACPAASQQAALIGIAAAWTTPLILMRAEPALRKADVRAANQSAFDFAPRPRPALRAVKMTTSESARLTKLTIHQNMRVPERSVIHSVFTAGLGYDEADEDLSWWEASDGSRLPPRPVRVKARWSGGAVDALVIDRRDTAKKAS